MKFKYKSKKEVTEFDRSNHLASMNGEVKPIPLKYSREVKLASKLRRDATAKRLDNQYKQFNYENSQNLSSARINKSKTGTLDRGIQLYRLWFQFLKLALELEDLKVDITIKKPVRFIKNYKNESYPVPQKVLDQSAKERFEERGGESSKDAGTNSSALFRCRMTQKIKVKRSAYKGWDLPQIKTSSFKDWWETHSHLFEGYYPSIIKSKNEWKDDPNFLYVRIDKTTQVRDVETFFKEKVSPQLKGKDKSSNRYSISGKNPRVNVLQNNYNALVLLLKGWTPKEIFQKDNNIYLRRTDEIKTYDDEGNDISRGQGDSLTIKGGNNYSSTVAPQKEMGIHHLLEVCEGRFGNAMQTRNMKDEDLVRDKEVRDEKFIAMHRRKYGKPK